MSEDSPHVLVTGVTGYLGSRLVVPLLEQGYQVRVLTRDADRIAGLPWADRVDVAEGDADDPELARSALRGIDVAYYLLHSMDGDGDFEQRDLELAQTFAAAAEAENVSRIVYLGGLHPQAEELSEHLASRVEVGRVFLDSAVPAAVLQAAILIGAASASFEMMRHVTDRLPAMVTPRWVNSTIQPIAIDDALHYLVGAATLPADVNRTFDIGGPDVLTYLQMMQQYAGVAGKHQRLIFVLPFLTPGLASHWIGLVTPVPTGVAKPLIGSLVHDVVCQENDLQERLGPPEGGPTPYKTAVRRALTPAPADQSPPPAAALWPTDPDWAG